MTQLSSFTLDCIFYTVPDRVILQGAYLEVKPGEICGLFGKNGSGKSTLLKIGAAQLRPDSGLTIIDGTRFPARSPGKRFKKIAYLPQESMLPGSVRVKQCLKSFSAFTGESSDPFISMLEDRFVSDLSGGERRYLELHLLLKLGRKYLILDEPFTGVEPKIIEKLMTRIKDEAEKGRGIIIADHYHRYLLQIINRAWLMNNRQCYPLQGDINKKLHFSGYFSSAESTHERKE